MPLSVGVTGMVANESPAPGIGVIRSLRAEARFDGRVVGLAYDALEAGNFVEGIADEVFLVPYPSQGEEDFFKRLSHVKKTAGLDVLIPTLDAELLPLIKMQGRLEGLGVATFLPTEEQFKWRGKDHLCALAERSGLPFPRSRVVYDAGSAAAAGREIGYPIFVKGLFYDACLARSGAEAEAHFSRIAAKWGLPVVLQELVAGDEYDVCALGDGKGGLVGAVPMRKVQLSDKGKAWAGVTVGDKKLNRLAQQAVGAMKWRGPLELEIMKSRKGYFILEVNPRFPAWVYLAQGAGQNLPYACLQLALGRKVKPFAPCRSGTMFIRAAMDHVMEVGRLERMYVKGQR